MGKQDRQPGDPLTPEQARALLRSTTVIRDPVHGDIRLTMLERLLVDSPEFQQLRHVKELAMVDLVYPGALHNRFLHSLGTLHVCSEMIRACNNATKMYAPAIVPVDDPIPVRIGYYAEFLARLAALLHDVTHVPFGHVFHKDAKVFKYDEWQDTWRVKRAIGVKSSIPKKLETFFREFFCTHEDQQIRLDELSANSAAQSVLKDITAALQAKDEDILNLRYPFVHDLVGNTICADLIDYVQRDMYYCGLTEGLGKRFLQYLGIMPAQFEVDSDGKNVSSMRPFRVKEANPVAEPRKQTGSTVCLCRAVIFLYRYNDQGSPVTKQNILAEVIDLVRRRKTVAEKLYFHKTKLIATSMLTTAAHASGLVNSKDLWGKSDYEVLKEMASLGTQDGTVVAVPRASERRSSDEQKTRLLRASKLGRDLLQRHLFKPIYHTSYHEHSGDDHSTRLWHEDTGAYARYCDPNYREKLIEKLEYAIGLHCEDSTKGVGCVCMSCPDKEMQLKEFNMLVLFRPDDTEIRRLEDAEKPIVRREISVIQEGHQELWCLEVFVDPEIVSLDSKFARQLAAVIQHEIGLQNELREFQGEVVTPVEDLINKKLLDSALRERKIDSTITQKQYDKVLETVSRSKQKDPRKKILDQLKSMGLLG